MAIRIHSDLVQGSDEWHAARCGMLTASEMKLIVTPTLKVASNEKERAHLYELLAQRITNYVEPSYVSEDMLRGKMDEQAALSIYAANYALPQQVGFVTNDKWGFKIGYSPDALVGEDGTIEIKSRRQKYQVETFVVHVFEGTIPADYLIQVQTGLLVTERAWCDLISFSAGLPMAVMRCYPDAKAQDAIVDAAGAFERRMLDALRKYDEAIVGAPATERMPDEMVA